MSAALESSILMVVMALVSAPLMLRDRVARKATGLQWLGAAWLGVGDAMNAFFFFRAYQTTSVAVAVLTHYLTPLFVAVAAPILLGERPTSRTAVSVLVGFAGLALLLQPWDAASRPHDVLGAIFGATSAVFYASNVLVTKRLTPVFSGSEQIFFHCLVALPLLAVLVPHGEWGAIDPRAAGIVVLGSLLPGTMGGLFFNWGLRRIAASRASTLTLLEPLVAVVVGVAAFGERVGAASIVGGGMILAGAAIVMSAPTGEARGT
jgi:drug/metabolite transporter (DMT)-like permease